MAKTLTSFAIFVAVICSIQLINISGVNADEKYFREYRQIVEDVSTLIDWNATLSRLPGYDCYEKRPLGIPPLGEELVFPCDRLSPSAEIPTSAHKVRPADIKVIGAMGDSLTAGNGAGACLVPELIFMYRGLIYSHGGDEDFSTNPSLANILREFNPELKGYGVERGNWDSEESGLNVGYPGDVSYDMPPQAESLIEKMKTYENIDYENDWKVITLFIGGNDLCASCNNAERYSPENYVANIREALLILRDNMPRAIINVVQVLQVYQVELMNEPMCNFFHMLFCSCGMMLSEEELAEFEALNKQYQVLLEEDIMSGQYDTKDDFTVVLQPFLQETAVPFTDEGEPDYSYFAPDCFHFSAKGHAQSGIELWNNMIEPVGAKRLAWNPGHTTISCPTEENPYIYTLLNSDFENPSPPAPTDPEEEEPTDEEPTEGAASMIRPVSVTSHIFLVCITLVFAALRR